MAVAALVTWVVAALGGFYLLAVWISKGGLRQQRGGPTRLPTGLVFGHLLLAAVGLVVWLLFVVNETSAAAWIALAIIVVTALFGFVMVARWLPSRRSSAGLSGEVAAESHLSLPVVLVHGLVAAATVVLVLLAALAA